jgi:hypothetical protein
MASLETRSPETAAVPAVTSPKVGISCSGGGIRAGAYALGCLQVLGEEGVLNGPNRARYITAVSGGSYAVSSVALVELSREEGTPAEKTMLPYAPGSPELKRLRNELGYLTHGPGGLRSDVWRALMGVVMNVGLFVAAIAFFSVIAGWVYGRIFPELRASCGTTDKACSTSVHAGTPAWLVTGIVAGVAVMMGLLWVMRRWSPSVARAWQRVSVNAILLAVVIAVMVLAVPQLLAWLHRASIPHRDVAASGVSDGIQHHQVAVGGFVGIVVAIGGIFTSAWKSLSALESNAVVKTVEKDVLGTGKRIVLTVLTALAVPVLCAALFLGFALQGAQHSVLVAGTSGLQWLYIVVPAVFVSFVYFVGDINSWSLHSIYRSRLSDAFNVERTTETKPDSPSQTNGIDARQRREHVALSRLADLHDFPEVRILATSNIRRYGVTPTGMDAASFLLSGDRIGGACVGTARTKAYERAIFRSCGAFSVMDAVSISGAAVAPEMGKMTRAPLRFLMALANVRLGVWIPKPSCVDEGTDPAGADARLKRRFRPPNLSYLLREAYGSTPERASDVYVTDGGHYDNLGLVELLRERCDWIWCIDASGDHIDTFTTIGQALSIAQAELNVTVDIQPRDAMQPDPAGSPFVKQPYCQGTITYPPLNGSGTTTGHIVIVKAGVPKDAPWSVAYYQAAHDMFPCDSTIDQLYKAERFDAYLALGRFSMQQAFDASENDFDALFSNRRTP